MTRNGNSLTPQRSARIRDLATALAAERPDLRTRVARAVALLEAGALVERPGADPWVRSQTGPGGYAVSPNLGCPCPDATAGRAPRLGPQAACKHWLAVLLFYKSGWTTAPVARARTHVTPFPARLVASDDEPIPYRLTARAHRLLDALDGDGPRAA